MPPFSAGHVGDRRPGQTSFFAVRRAGARLRNKAYPMVAPGNAKFFDRLEERRRLDEFLQTNLSANANFKAGVAIFTPLAGSVVSLVLTN
jgi:hypothetical protein